MIDWITAVIPFRHPRIENGQVIKIDENGQVVRNFPTRRRFSGSYESSIGVASNDVTHCRTYANQLFLDGNPTKFLQGHNIIGSDSVTDLTYAALDTLCKQLDMSFDDFTKQRVRQGNFIVKRLDVTHYYQLANQETVTQFLAALSKKSKTRSGRAMNDQGTVYFNKHSKYWAWKFYSKFNEITKGGKGHSLPPELLNTPLLDWTRDKVRAELVLRKMELKRIAQQDNQYAEEIYAYQLNEKRLKQLYNDYLGKIDMSAQMVQADNAVLELPNSLRGTFQLWKEGKHIRDYLSKPTFYRHRTEIKQRLDIDIALPPVDVKEQGANVIPMLSVVKAEPAQVPDNLLQFKCVH